MTLDEAIKHCEEKAKEIRWQALKERMDIEGVAECETCAEEHEQLAEWLKDYKRLLEDRQQDEEWLDSFIKNFNASRDFKITDIRDREKLLDDLRPKGRWLRTDDMFETLVCSACGYDTGDYDQYNFCPNCGAKMRKGR